MSLSAQSLAEVRFAGRPAERRERLAHPHRCPGGRLPLGDDMLATHEQQFVSAVLAPSGLTAEAYRARPLRRRIAAALRSVRASDIDAGLEAVHREPGLADRVLNTLLIGYTAPFRDEPVFQRLRDSVLPALVTGRTGLHIWSAACSNGAELYSVALLLAERGCLAHSTLRGTDGRAAAIAEAPHSARTFWTSIPTPFLDLKTKRLESHFFAHAQRITWQVENVFACTDEARFDLILCRNLAIYLQPEAAARLWEILARALVPEGILITGKAEKPLPGRQWRRLDTCVYQTVQS
ncbi:MAG: CheR family methyltransferase [Candidatus Tectimicrobiota bacterium]